ncbi:putative zinc binding protein [Isoptericola sp. CG 20/1183]|uniref:Zinc binding protein n=1 Tax=Isoptericola halotolerans TaxID=300560 RepID=A0ABX5EDC9_9MICO|nr:MULTISPECIES: methyltransferase domain-containing protein [Isoptericola]PRZ06407.1 putative zinc binding protein [Isoptericola halotolerans]PRZ06787.1 putative zinc binding protein [Isoptericola sp. CG 20/1183]
MGARPVTSWRCRWCGADDGSVVLDLGEQPAADAFPPAGATGADDVYPLRMVLCAGCGLAQLEEDPTDADEPRGIEPAALVAQAREAVDDLAAAGLAASGARVAEQPSPHGGSWLGQLAERGLTVVPDEPGADDEERVDLLVDSLGMMHDADQRAALADRADQLAPEGVLALHVHPLGTILRTSAWNALRHGHYAYYSVTWLVRAAREVGVVPVGLWRYALYGGTVVLALVPAGSRRAAEHAGSAALADLDQVLDDERVAGVTDPDAVGRLQAEVTTTATALRAWVDDHRAEGIVGYGAASRAVALLAAAGVTGRDVRAVVDASAAKSGLSMPGTAGADGAPRIPIVEPAALGGLRPRWVVLFVPDLLDEVRRAYPEVEASGGSWVVAEPAPVVVAPDGITTR